jgi:hypothetical protein
MAFFSLFFISVLGTQFGLQVQKTFVTPELEDYFLQNPLSFDLDSGGNLYVVDGEAKVIFKWGADGKFLQTIGTPGQGPGEFSFSGRGPAMGYVYVIGDELFVFDGVQRKVSVFSMEGAFKRSPSLVLPRSRTMGFVVLSPSEFLILNRRYKDDQFMVSLKILDAAGKVIKTLKEMKDDTISFTMKNNRPRSMSIKAYNPVLTMGFNSISNTAFIGFSGDPGLEIIPRKGTPEKIELALMQRELTQADKDETNELAATFQRRRPIKYSFPEKMPYYKFIYSLENGDIFVFNDSPYTHHIEGTLFSSKGKPKGKVDTVLGEGGGLLNARGRILRYRLNAEDEYVIELVHLKEK